MSGVGGADADLCSESLTTDLYEFLFKYLSKNVLKPSLIK